MWKTVFFLMGILLLCIWFVSLIHQEAAPYIIKRPGLPPGYRKNDYTVQNVIEDDTYYHCYYKFRALDGTCVGWKWKYDRETLDRDIARFGIPDSVLANYWGTAEQMEQIRAGFFHIREQSGNITTFGVNHNAVVNAYYQYTKPIAALLKKTLARGELKDEWRDIIGQLLYFTQDIPYGVPANKYDDKYYYGFFPPPLCLITTWGDCDTKAVLFCSVLSHFPGYELLTLDFPGHASVAVKGIPKTYERYVEYLGEQYIMCEPVGPNHSNFGDTMYPASRVEMMFPIKIDEQMRPFPTEDVEFSEDILGSSEYEEKLAMGIAAFHEHEYDGAKQIFFDLGLEYPGEYLPLYYLGMIYKQEKDEVYTSYFTRAIELCKASPKKDFTLKVHCGDMLYDCGLYNDALAYYNLAYKEKNDDYYVLFRIGKCYYLQEKFPWAIKFFLLAYEQKPENVVIPYYLAQSYIKNNQKDNALSYLEAAYKLDPYNIEVGELLLHYHMTKLNISLCDLYINHLLTLDAGNIFALYSRARIYFFTENYEAGLEVLQSIPEDSYTTINELHYYFWEGLFLSALGKSGAEASFIKAAVLGKKMIEQESADAPDYIYYGCAAAESEEYGTDALQHIQNVIRKDRYNRGFYSLANARLTEFSRSPDSALPFYIDAIKQYQQLEENILLYLCYYYIEKIYNAKKLDVLSPIPEE